MGAQIGTEVAPAAKKAASSGLRRAGDPLNTLGYPVVHERVFLPPGGGGKPARFCICRCWQSLKFPLCDNTHQRLQKQGVNVGPVMLEIKSGVPRVGASSTTCCSAEQAPRNLGPQAFAAGGVAAAVLAGAAHMAGGGGSPPL
mmetsp:Transcript_946/g.2407  ORF Transcript_946/g.2407 Transcript_946/m.2407 type:complete len:143 (-) Transcript_946:36-464(-)